ncbi:MAG TPA: divergent PAP2 family protein [Clostridiaceae bacterium]|nr:divergent PAP2 family protein [Clostridiaceae bacterium]
MEFIESIFSNKAIVVPALTWFIAQFIKVLTVLLTEKKLDFTRFVGTGGMPSAHASYVVCVATVVGKNLGFGSIEFGIATAFALVVMQDAAGVRRAAGKQAEILNKIIYSNDFLHMDEKLKELLGHTPFQVIVGALMGIAIGLLLG